MAGPRQVGKTTLVHQVTAEADIPVRFASADEPTLRGTEWVAQQWDAARLMAGSGDGVLVLDEVQKAIGWAESAKRLWDEDTREKRRLRVVLLGSAPLLIQQGSLGEPCGPFRDPAPVPLVRRGDAGSVRLASGALHLLRWVSGCRATRCRLRTLDSLHPGFFDRDDDLSGWLLHTRVDKPALLQRLFELGCRYSGQVLSYTKMLGQLQDAGNTTTLAHYLDLLSAVGMLTGLSKYAGQVVRRRGSSPKLQVLNTALMSTQASLTFKEPRADPSYWGRLVESAIGAHLANATMSGTGELYYWRERNREGDFVMSSGRLVRAIVVRSGAVRDALAGMAAFSDAFHPGRKLLVGGGGVSVADFLLQPVEHWIT